jgi:sec-independent protein translocase protein TatA
VTSAGGWGAVERAMNLGGPEMLIVLAVVLLMFGSKKVPELARSLGKAQREFKDGLRAEASPSSEPVERA